MTDPLIERVKGMILSAYLDMDASDLAKRMNAGMSAHEAVSMLLDGIIPEVISAYQHAALPVQVVSGAVEVCPDCDIAGCHHIRARQKAALPVQDTQAAERISALSSERDEWKAVLADPVAVHLNMLRGGIAKPSIRNIIHLYGADELRAALNDKGSAE
jgi:hypothetical protein